MAKTFNYPDAIFIQRLEEIKKEQGLTDIEIGRRVGAKKNTVQMWRYGVNTPNGIYIRRLALQLNVSADYLLGLSDRKEILK